MEAHRRIEQFDVLWIEPVPLAPEYPIGFALRVLLLLGLGDPDRHGDPMVWVRGLIIHPVTGGGRALQLLLPDDQPKADLVPPRTFLRPGTFDKPPRELRSPWERVIPVEEVYGSTVVASYALLRARPSA
jgi:hypothetical protein